MVFFQTGIAVLGDSVAGCPDCGGCRGTGGGTDRWGGEYDYATEELGISCHDLSVVLPGRLPGTAYVFWGNPLLDLRGPAAGGFR